MQASNLRAGAPTPCLSSSLTAAALSVPGVRQEVWERRSRTSCEEDHPHHWGLLIRPPYKRTYTQWYYEVLFIYINKTTSTGFNIQYIILYICIIIVGLLFLIYIYLFINASKTEVKVVLSAMMWEWLQFTLLLPHLSGSQHTAVIRT